MEPAKIDWINLKSVFVVDDLYEHINAPQWIDFSAPIDPVDDESWFCTLECKHPKTAEDFLKETPNSKIKKSVFPLGTLKRRGFSQSSNSPNMGSKTERFIEDGENQNPNVYTPSKQFNSMKAKILSSASEKKKKQIVEEDVVHKLKRTFSGRNLFTGRNLLGPITEFCNELKKLAMRTKEKEKSEIGSPLLGTKIEEIERKRKPLLEKSPEIKSRSFENEENSNIIEEKPRRKKKDDYDDDGENIIPQPKDNGNKVQILTSAPKPQCFSANRQPLLKSSTPKPSRPKTLITCGPKGRGILQELEQGKEETVDNNNNNKRDRTAPVEKEEQSLNVFWFLKPCTYATN